MHYISTRGKAPTLNFEDVLLTGLANDGGLYVPEHMPFFGPEAIAGMAKLSYEELAYAVISPFVSDSIPEEVLKKAIAKAYRSFRHTAIAPLKQLGHNEWLLELFHGPTLAFKDFALQLLGQLLDYVLEKRGEKIVILGATSGDTGSAAIAGCMHCWNAEIFILHPHNRVSEVQRRQMTTILADNVHNIALEGTFDDCQHLVKTLFLDQGFLQGKRRLVAVNSINWARIMAQIVYYFYAALALGAPAKSVAFSVPTGNFGDIYAGFIARKMGLPIHQLVIATNKNDILHRFLSQNQYRRDTLHPTLSPSMDIQVSSNLERLLFDLYEGNGEAINQLMAQFKDTGNLTIEPHRLERARALFDSYRVDDEQTVQAIRQVYDVTGEVVDPHTVIGITAAQKTWRRKELPMVSLATAHPAKFAEAITKAGLPAATLPPHMSDLLTRQERVAVLPNQEDALKEMINKRL